MRASRVVVTNLSAVAGRRRARARTHASSSSDSTMEVLQFPALSDNYGFAIRCARTNAVALVDAPEEDAIARALDAAKWPAPSAMLNTHWHGDHVGANEGLRKRFPGMTVHAPKAEVGKIGGRVDVEVSEGDVVRVGELECEVRETPGHTLGHVVYHFKAHERVFVGDTLFAPDYGTARCDFPGGDAKVLFQSVKKLLAFPPETRIFLCHDYLPGGRELQLETSVAAERESNIHVHEGVDEASFVTMRTERDATLSMPVLILPSVQVNMRAGALPPAEDNGMRYLKIPLNAF